MMGQHTNVDAEALCSPKGSYKGEGDVFVEDALKVALGISAGQSEISSAVVYLTSGITNNVSEQDLIVDGGAAW